MPPPPRSIRADTLFPSTPLVRSRGRPRRCRVPRLHHRGQDRLIMPYAVRKAGSSYKVVKKDGGKVLGTHTSKAKAQAQIRAIHAGEGKQDRKSTRLNSSH